MISTMMLLMMMMMMMMMTIKYSFWWRTMMTTSLEQALSLWLTLMSWSSSSTTALRKIALGVTMRKTREQLWRTVVPPAPAQHGPRAARVRWRAGAPLSAEPATLLQPLYGTECAGCLRHPHPHDLMMSVCGEGRVSASFNLDRKSIARTCRRWEYTESWQQTKEAPQGAVTSAKVHGEMAE